MDMQHAVRRQPRCFGRNLLAVLVVGAATAIGYWNVQPEPVSGVTSKKSNATVPLVSLSTNLASSLAKCLPDAPRALSGSAEKQASQTASQPSNAADKKQREQQQLSASDPQPQTPKKAKTADRPDAFTSPANGTNLLTGRPALLVNLLMLEKSEQLLEAVTDYTAIFQKRERINGKLTDLQKMAVKIRHHPFSVYMKWLSGRNKGRQVLYVEGQNNNRMLVKFGGWKRRLPALKLDPTGSLAMAEARYPITKLGLLELVREVIPYRKRDLQHPDKVRCVLKFDTEFEGQLCYACVVEYQDKNYSPTYRKSIFLLDQQSLLPVVLQNFTWPDAVENFDPDDVDGSTLLEYYAYTHVQLNQQLADSEFDRHNKAYRF